MSIFGYLVPLIARLVPTKPKCIIVKAWENSFETSVCFFDVLVAVAVVVVVS